MAPWRELRPGQRSVIMIGFADGSAPVEVFRTDTMVVEAPNWTRDGEWLIVNAVGRLWRLSAAGGGALEPIELELPALNNDHVLDPDGEHVFVSAADGHLYRALLAGGAAHRVSNASRPDGFIHYLHGVSPDGSTLAYIGGDPDRDRHPGARLHRAGRRRRGRPAHLRRGSHRRQRVLP